jgi:hypothetical protein
MSVKESQLGLLPRKPLLIRVIGIVVAVVLLLGVGHFLFIQVRYWQWRSAHSALNDKIASLATRNPTAKSPSKWSDAVEWTRNLIHQVYSFRHSAEQIASLKRLAVKLDQKAKVTADYSTLRWLWDEIAADNPESRYPMDFWNDQLLVEDPIQDDDLPGLRLLKKRSNLDLAGYAITDAGLKHLEGLVNLRYLVLDNTQVTDDGLEKLQNLPNLDQLHLSNCAITDLGLKHLESLEQLHTLILNHTKITDVGLESISKLTQLKQLQLSHTEVSDDGLRHLGDLSQLVCLILAETRISDEGLAHLKGLTQIWTLDLSGTNVTDAGLEYLTVGWHLNLENTKVTHNGMVKFRERHPNCQVSH